MAGPIYVIGHKYSDMDSIASAYAYARLLQLQGEEQAIPTRHGNLKPEVRFVLERFKVEAPEALEDVYLQVRDVMRRGVISARIDGTRRACRSRTGGDCRRTDRAVRTRAFLCRYRRPG